MQTQLTFMRQKLSLETDDELNGDTDNELNGDTDNNLDIIVLLSRRAQTSILCVGLENEQSPAQTKTGSITTVFMWRGSTD
jgi:hypothetical protein